MTSKPAISNDHPVFPPLAGLFLGILAVSTASIFIRFAQAEVPSLVIAAGRMGFATLLISPFVFFGKTKRDLQWGRQTWSLIILAGVFLGFHFATWITSLEYTSVASSVVLVTTAPLWVALLAPIFLKERLTRYVLIGLAISLAGSVIVSLSGNCSLTSGTVTCSGLGEFFQGQHFLGNLLALAGAFLSGGYLMVGRKVRSRVNLTSYAFFVYLIASIVLFGMVLITGQSLTGYSLPAYGWMLALALVPQLVGHTSFNGALKYLPAAFVSIALLGEPVGSVILAYLFLHETPVLFEIIGGILILVGIAFSTLRKPQVQEDNPL